METELEYQQLLVVMVFLVEVIDITQVVAVVAPVIQAHQDQQVLVEKVVAVLVK